MGEQRPSTVAWTSWHHHLHGRLSRQPALLPDGTKLLLALSGGQDSMALLALLQGLQPKHRWTLRLWHGDHGWHPGSTAIANELQQWCTTQGLDLQVEQAPQDLARTEAAARRWRYDALEQRARSIGADVVTGHTASDRAETLLLQIARGSDLAGLTALRPVRPLSPDGPQLGGPCWGSAERRPPRSAGSWPCRSGSIPATTPPPSPATAFVPMFSPRWRNCIPAAVGAWPTRPSGCPRCGTPRAS